MFNITPQYRETKVNPIKEYLRYLYDTYVHYDIVKITLRIYPYDTIDIIKNIIYLLQSIEFSKVFTLFNFFVVIDYILTKIIAKLQAIKNYDIVKFIECVSFYIEYFIYKYYYSYNEFHFIYLCRYSPTYYSLCLKHFLNLEYKKDLGPQFYYFLGIGCFLVVYCPTFYAVTKYIERYNTLDNVYHYYISTISPC
uniref:Uncharacterized protein n=2 Tax=Babesia TaxID=5864 RepID=A0A411AD82_9APIC|nr:hypothetical protein BLAP_18 [Babesia sp. Lintan]QAX27041.1 hypothetical protein [Babesia motasi]QAX27072.1 hypothetical protein [Babesia motasi]